MLEILLALGLVAGSATQFRDRATLGPGEVPLLLWLLLAGAILVYHRASLKHSKVCLLFLVVANGLLIAGTLQARPPEFGSPSWKGLMAFNFAWLGPLLLAQLPSFEQRCRRFQQAWLIAAGAVFTLLLGLSQTATSLRDTLNFDHGRRFCGLCANPNQTALFVLALPLLLSRSSAPLWLRLPANLAFIALGLASGSDALLLAWALGGFLQWTLKPRSAATQQFGLVLVVVAALWGYGPSAQPKSQAVWQGVSAQQDVATRATLSHHGLQAAARSPWVGWGPGAYSGETGPFQNFEAHNSWVDWATNAGFLGLAAYLAAAGWWIRNLWKQGGGGLGLFLALLVFSSFHYTFRQPIFWFSWLLCLEEGKKP